MLWHVQSDFRALVPRQNNEVHAMRIGIYRPDNQQHPLQQISISQFYDGSIQVCLQAQNEQAMNALKIAMGPVHFMKKTAPLRLYFLTQDKPLMAVFFKKLVENQPEFAPHALSLQAIIGIDPSSANDYPLPTWFKEPWIYSNELQTTYYSGNEVSRFRRVFFKKTDDNFYVSLDTDNAESATRLMQTLTGNRAFPTQTLEKHIPKVISIYTSDNRLLRFFMQKLVEAQPDFSDTATEVLAQMDLSRAHPYSMEEIEHMYPAAQPPAPVEMQQNLNALNAALIYSILYLWSMPLRPIPMHMPSEQPLLLSRTTPVESPAEQNFLDENAETEMICPITNTLMFDPVYARNSGSDRCFERAAIEQWIQRSLQTNSEGVQVARHPLTGTSISMSMLVGNEALKTAIEAYKANAKKLGMK